MTRKLWILGLVVAAATLSAACGGGAPASPSAQQGSSAPSASSAAKAASPAASSSSAPAASPAPYSPLTYAGSDRMAKLTAEAKKEGKLTWYTSLAGQLVEQISANFKQDYGIEVAVVRSDESAITTRAVQEDLAGRTMADVVQMSGSAMLEFRDLKLLQPYYSPLAKTLPKGLTMPASGDLVLGVASNFTIFSFAYNKNLLAGAAVPKKFEDLLSPSLKGKMSISSTSTGVWWTGMVLHKLGDAKGREFLSKMAAQEVTVQSISGAALMDLIGQGQVVAGPAIYKNHTEQQQDKGAPVEWIPLDNLAAISPTPATVIRKAPNPNAAVLFIEWITAGRGQKVLEENRYAIATSKMPFDVWVPGGDAETAAQYQNMYDSWQQLFDQTFRK